MAWDQLKYQLTVDEAVRKFAYQDTNGFWTIGIGRNVDKRGGRGLSDDEILYLLENDLKNTEHDLDAHFKWWRNMTPARQDVLMNMCFNLGINRLLQFHNFLGACAQSNWDHAAAEMEDSLWYRQVGARGVRLRDAMKKG